MGASGDPSNEDSCATANKGNHNDSVVCPDNPSMEKVSDCKISKLDYQLGTAVSVLTGILGYFIYYQMVFSFVALKVIWPTDVFMYILGGCEYSMAALFAFIMLPINSLRTRYIYISCSIYVAAAFVVPLTATLFPGMDNFPVARGLLVCVSLTVGAADTLMMVSGLSIAASLPNNRIAIYSGGSGFASAIPWLIFLLMSEVVFDKSLEGQVRTLWASFSVTFVLSGVLMICMWMLARRPWFNAVMTKAASHHRSQFPPGENRWKKMLLGEDKEVKPLADDNKDSDDMERSSTKQDIDVENSEGLPPARGFLAVAKDCSLQAFNTFILLVMTMMIYPTIAPYGFHQSDLWTTILGGLGHFVHVFGRFAPAYIPFLLIKPKFVLPAILTRAIILFPLFIIINRRPDIQFLVNVGFLVVMVVVASTTHGVLGTLTDMYTIDSVSHPQERATALKVLIICQLLSSAIGQFCGGLLAA